MSGDPAAFLTGDRGTDPLNALMGPGLLFEMVGAAGVPEPGTLLMMLPAIAALGFSRRRRHSPGKSSVHRE